MDPLKLFYFLFGFENDGNLSKQKWRYFLYTE